MLNCLSLLFFKAYCSIKIYYHLSSQTRILNSEAPKLLHAAVHLTARKRNRRQNTAEASHLVWYEVLGQLGQHVLGHLVDHVLARLASARAAVLGLHVEYRVEDLLGAVRLVGDVGVRVQAEHLGRVVRGERLRVCV